VLQERCFERVGSSLAIGIDVRVIATSNRDLPKSVARGDFRQDLFFRLNVLPIHLPPLRDRLEDIPELVRHFAVQIARREGKPVRTFSEECLATLKTYTWPGNVRELQNVVERAAVLSRGDIVERSLVEPWLSAGEAMPSVNGYAPGPVNGHHNGIVVERKPPVTIGSGGEPALIPVEGRALEEIERDAIVRTLTRFNGHRQQTAKALGIGVRTLGLKLKKWKEMHLVEPSL
jgi:DNA-binding NtrC family response regulator